MTNSKWLRALGAVVAASAVACAAQAQGNAKKELVQKVLQAQQAEIEAVSRGLIERPAAQMMQEARLVLAQAPADKRDAMARSIEAEVKKYVEDAYPVIRERALKIAPLTIGATLEEKMTEDELKQLLAWLDSPTNRKFQQLGTEMRNSFIQKLVADAQPVVDPKVQALDGRIRTILGVGPAPSRAPAGPAASASKVGAKAAAK